MSELGSGSGSSYPGALDTNNTAEVDSPNAGKTLARADVPNDLAAAVVAIEGELGVDPAGSAATVVARIDNEHAADGTHSDITASSVIITNGRLELDKGADVASASAVTLGSDGNIFDITGTTTITTIGTLGLGTVITLHFDGVLTLTSSANALVLPESNDILTAAGDEATFYEYSTGWWRLMSYSRPGGIATRSTELQITAAAASPPTANALVKSNIMKAWLNMDGTGTISINGSFNVSGIVDNGVGDYTISWDTDFADINYCWTGSGIDPGSTNHANVSLKNGTTLAVGAMTIIVTNSGAAAIDITPVCVMAIGEQ